jgi:hypothetical protein
MITRRPSLKVSAPGVEDVSRRSSGTAVSGLAQLAGLTVVLFVVLLVRVARERREDQWPYESESTAADSP